MMSVSPRKFIEWIVQNWSRISGLNNDVNWQDVRDLFRKGVKQVGFVKRPAVFKVFLKISGSTYAKKFQRYIINDKWNSYLIRSIDVRNLYDAGKKAEADAKKQELNKEGMEANRICNLYCSGILDVIFHDIISAESKGETFADISNSSTRMLQDFINNDAIIYVNNSKSGNNLIEETERSLANRKFCILIGSGNDNIEKINDVFDELQKKDSSWQIQSWRKVKGGGIKELTGFVCREGYVKFD